MPLNIRQKQILEQLNAQGHCSISQLAVHFRVTEETIRRDVRQLEQQRMVEKIHGGVRLPEHHTEGSFYQRLKDQEHTKLRIGKRAASMIPDGSSIFIDSGSTSYFTAKSLREQRDLSVISNSLEVARELRGRNGNHIYFAGGELDSEYGACFGSFTLNFVQSFRAEFAILSIAAIDAQSGFTDMHLPEAEFKRSLIPLAKQVIVVADSRKFNLPGLMVTANIQDVDYLITDKQPEGELRKALKDINIIVAN
ncbi:MAG: DeoR/GlpR family DNA-binding transcription regulator [Cellvibrionaceae bacterium]|nr:DeoR/GlpR family DNA-binding transcription regulator [Cellvibrionaceae bacterium]MCV6628197.1 DeoR/GlpR family DNA-binding transcription regulator [Cellvibrionaceae bacterium]